MSLTQSESKQNECNNYIIIDRVGFKPNLDLAAYKVVYTVTKMTKIGDFYSISIYIA